MRGHRLRCCLGRPVNAGQRAELTSMPKGLLDFASRRRRLLLQSFVLGVVLQECLIQRDALRGVSPSDVVSSSPWQGSARLWEYTFRTCWWTCRQVTCLGRGEGCRCDQSDLSELAFQAGLPICEVAVRHDRGLRRLWTIRSGWPLGSASYDMLQWSDGSVQTHGLWFASRQENAGEMSHSRAYFPVTGFVWRRSVPAWCVDATCVSLCIAAVLGFASACLSTQRARQRARKGQCLRCGYQRSRPSSDRCPECGRVYDEQSTSIRVER